MDKRCGADITMYTESMVQGKGTTKSVACGLVFKVTSFSFETFAIVFSGLDGGTGLYLKGHLDQAIVHPQWISQTHAYNVFKIDMSNKSTI